MPRMPIAEKDAILELYFMALESGDVEVADSLAKKMPLSPYLAKSVVEINGYEHAQAMGYNFSDVESIYGKNWYESI